MDKYAVIDLGTNTFHLIVASFDEEDRLNVFYRDRQYIYLAEDGIKTIGDSAIKRAMRCIHDFKKAIDKYKPDKIYCSGTAALRTASNGEYLTSRILVETGIRVKLIDGLKEARYIYKGVSLAVPQTQNGNFIIMDIGGGSVEFIIIEEGKLIWEESFPIGIAILKERFHKTEPIESDSVQAMNLFLTQSLESLLIKTHNRKYQALIGASGSFEVLSGMFEKDNKRHLNLSLPIDFFESVYKELLKQDLKTRLARTDIPNSRVHLIVVAFHLMHFILDKIEFEELIVSAYAMKEGMLQELAKDK